MEIVDFRKLPEVKNFGWSANIDHRGLWRRIWDQEGVAGIYQSAGVAQVSVSASHKKFTLRGIHSLREEAGEFKAVICVDGAIQDVVVDLREWSATRYRSDSLVLNSEGLNGVLIPPGFGHAFLTLTDSVTLIYLMSVPYDKNLELRHSWNDPAFDIEWAGRPEVISDADAEAAWVSTGR